MRTILRRMKGALVNSAFWFVVWFGLGLAIDLAIRVPAGDLVYKGALYLRPTLNTALASGVLGAVIGGAFSTYIALNFGRSRDEGLNPWRFAFGGALVTLAVLLAGELLTNMTVLTDRVLVEPFALYGDLVARMIFAAGIGGATAFGTIKLAQHGAEAEQLEDGREPLLLDG